MSFILGNDLAGGNVWNQVNSEVLPQVVTVPGKTAVHDCVEKNPDVFPTCAITRAMLRKGGRSFSPAEYELSDSFFVNLESEKSPESIERLSVIDLSGPDRKIYKSMSESACSSRTKLIAAQKADMSLVSLFRSASSDINIDKEPQCFFFQDGVLRKWRPYNVPDHGNSVHQIVMPVEYRDKIECSS